MKNMLSWLLYGSLLLLFLLHNDFWFWETPQLMLGLPIGLLYHIVYCLTITLIMATLVKYLWRE